MMHVLVQLVPGAFGMQVDKKLCVGCGLCNKKCPMQALSIAQGKAQINRHHCIVCGQCRQACPRKAIEYTNGLHREVAKHDVQE